MNKFLIIFCLVVVNNIQSQINPFESIGKEGEIITLSRGKYSEYYSNDTLQRIGSVIVNTKTGTLYELLNEDTLYSEATLDPTIISRWYSPDPLEVKFPGMSPYNFCSNNPIVLIDPDGREPIYPKTGKPFHISYLWANIYSYDDGKGLAPVVDQDLLDAATFNNRWYVGVYEVDDKYYDGEDVAYRGLVKDKISEGADKALEEIFGEPRDINKPAKPSNKASLMNWQTAAESGTYTFVDDALSESYWFNANKSRFKIISVEQNYITQIVQMVRDPSDDDNEYSVSSVTTFDTEKGEVKSRDIYFLGVFMYTEKYRELTVTETVQNYENNEATGSPTVTTYTVEEIID